MAGLPYISLMSVYAAIELGPSLRIFVGSVWDIVGKILVNICWQIGTVVTRNINVPFGILIRDDK